LADAFEAATGYRIEYTELKDGETIITKPLRIIDLPFGKALLTERSIEDGCHACTGAIGLFYIQEDGDKTFVTGRWPDAIGGWGWGAPPTKWDFTDKFTSMPAIFAEGSYMGQGISVSGATLTELTPKGPVTSDLIGLSYDDSGSIADDDGRAACNVKGVITNIKKDTSFDVRASGSVSALDRYVKRNGRFVAGNRIDWQLPCPSE
jgi:hypothetical protein